MSQSVILPDGQRGIVVAEYKDMGCGCKTVIVRLETGKEWIGKRSEVRVA